MPSISIAAQTMLANAGTALAGTESMPSPSLMTAAAAACQYILCCRLVCPSGVIASYLHASSAPGLGKMGALVALADSKGATLNDESASRLKVCIWTRLDLQDAAPNAAASNLSCLG